MKKRTFTIEEQLKRLKKRFFIVLFILIVVTMLTGVYIYMSYDYLAFKHFITGNYIYTGALDDIFKKEIKTDVKGKYFSYFDDLVISVVTKRIREENNDRYTYLYTPESLKSYLKDEKQEASLSEIKILDENTVYLRLSNFSTFTRDFMDDNVNKLKSRPNIIMDLLDNRGGDIDSMVDMAGMFLPKKSIIATDKMRLLNIIYKNKKDKPLNYKKIIILQNKNTASASENMIAALKDNLDNVVLIGEETYGKGIGQFTLPLKRGFAVKATILEWFTPKGINIQGNGIDPDIAYSGKDIILYALDKLAG
jgi:C-terminal processing protease CtpA/Prc